jgi:hypothetical protein
VKEGGGVTLHTLSWLARLMRLLGNMEEVMLAVLCMCLLRNVPRMED